MTSERPSVGEGNQALQGCPYLICTAPATPGLDHRAVVGNQDRDWLVGHAVPGEYFLSFIETPHDVSGPEQLPSALLGGLEVRLPRRGDEIDSIRVFGRQGVDDGQLPLADRSPLRPEDQIDRPLALRESVGASLAQFECEVWGYRTVGWRGLPPGRRRRGFRRWIRFRRSRCGDLGRGPRSCRRRLDRDRAASGQGKADKGDQSWEPVSHEFSS